MASSRREFLKMIGAAGAAGAVPAQASRAASGPEPSPDWLGMLTDLSVCIGCRKCEFACQESNGLPHNGIGEFEDDSVFEKKRRPEANRFTVVNRYGSSKKDAKPVYVKTQCMHCNEPACASACPVGAIRKKAEGPVVYDASVCIGCRYCMVACPFSMPAYTYDSPFSPAVRKCSMCFEAVSKPGGVPACARICPVEAITFGRRDQLLELARERIRRHPDRYVNHVYGEHEVGGTCWLYIAPRPFSELGFRTDLGRKAYPERTAGFLSMVPLVVTIWPAVLLGAYALTRPRQEGAADRQVEPQGESKGA